MYFIIFKFLSAYSCFTMLCSSLLQQSASAVCIHLSPLFWVSHLFRSPQSTEQSSLCLIVGSLLLSIVLVVIYSYSLFWLCWVFVAAQSLVAGCGLSVVALGLSCPSACGILVHRPGIKPQLDSLPRDHQGSP